MHNRVDDSSIWRGHWDKPLAKPHYVITAVTRNTPLASARNRYPIVSYI